MSKNDYNIAKCYLDRESYERILQEIEDESFKLKMNNRNKGDLSIVGSYENWDAKELTDIEERAQLISNDIELRRALVDNAVIIEKTNEKDIVDLGDILRLNIIDDGDVEEIIVKLVCVPEYNYSDDNIYQEEISIATPIGKAILGRKVGDEITYEVGEMISKIKILEKMNNVQEKKSIFTKKLKK